VWHTDMSYLDVPPKASMLYALEVPPSGGNTSFCTMYGIYEALPQTLKDRVAGLKIKHDGTYHSGGYLRQGVTPTPDPLASSRPLARCGAPAHLHAPRHRPAHALSRPPPQRLPPRAHARGVWGAARGALALRRSAGIRLGARLARRRSRVVGQSLHHAPARRLRPQQPAHHAPHPSQGRASALLIRASLEFDVARLTAPRRARQSRVRDRRSGRRCPRVRCAAAPSARPAPISSPCGCWCSRMEWPSSRIRPTTGRCRTG